MDSIFDSSGFLTTSDFHLPRYTPYGSFNGLESDIRNAHLDRFTPLDTQDSRFTGKSWMNVHAWALSYLHLWCIRPQSNGSISLKQRIGAVLLKPIAALLDATTDAAIFCCWSVVLIDAIVMKIFSNLLKQSTGGIKVTEAFSHTLSQINFLGDSLGRLFLQPPNLLLNLFSPSLDCSYVFGLLPGISYIVEHKGYGSETILDQGRVKYLRENLGWESISDAILKLTHTHNTNRKITYWEENSKVCIQVNFLQIEYDKTGFFADTKYGRRFVNRSLKNH